MRFKLHFGFDQSWLNTILCVRLLAARLRSSILRHLSREPANILGLLNNLALGTQTFNRDIHDIPLNYGDDGLLLTGYADSDQLKTLENTPALALHRLGQGKIVLLSHDANFRAFWLGTERSYANALFFTQATDYRRD